MKKIFLSMLLAVCAASYCLADIKFEDNGFIRCGKIKIRMSCISGNWAWRDTSKLKDVKISREDSKFSMSGNCRINSSTVKMAIDSSKAADGFYQVQGKCTVTPEQKFARCIWNINYNINDTELTVDGRKVKVTTNGKKGIVFYKAGDKVVIGQADAKCEILTGKAVVMVEYAGAKGKDTASLSIVFPSSTGVISGCSSSIKVREVTEM